jgi:hypothetical protein
MRLYGSDPDVQHRKRAPDLHRVTALAPQCPLSLQKFMRPKLVAKYFGRVLLSDSCLPKRSAFYSFSSFTLVKHRKINYTSVALVADPDDFCTNPTIQIG